MNGVVPARSFFSFGPDGSYISNSYEGFRHHNLPPTLHNLVVSGTVAEVYSASLGPVQESWVLSFKDREGKYKVGFGDDTPYDLQDIFDTLTPSPHLHAFLGPKDSFIAWDPTFIRWVGLPSALEACLQRWLTPAGWKAGPPRFVSWGVKGAYFALSEYGDVEYRLGSSDRWPIFRETVEEWEGEAGLDWGNLAYITLDPTALDQFVAIRSDRIWAGSISDNNEDALQSFASNFFSRAKSKNPKSKPRQDSGQDTGTGTTDAFNNIPTPAEQALYEKWATEVASAVAAAVIANGGKSGPPKKLQVRNQNAKALIPMPSGPTEGKLLKAFPYLPPGVTACKRDACVEAKSDPDGVRACKHDVERLFRASGLYSYEWLRQERIRWHPDRFGRLCAPGWREEGRRLAEEMFKIIDCLIVDFEKTGSNGVN